MISNVIIVHGSNATEEDSKSRKWGPENLRHWKPWIKKKLEEEGIVVSNEIYPRDWLPDYEEWKNVFEENEIDENTVLVGHNAGAAFILRWLAENKKKVNKVILVAPYIVQSNTYSYLNEFNDFKIDSALKNYFNELTVFYADDDDEDIILHEYYS